MLAIGTLMVFVTALGFISTAAYDRATKDYQTSQTYSEAQREFERRCVGLEGDEIFDCLSKQIQTAREPARSEEEVQAQKEMARWAWWMLLVTGGIGFGTIAVAFAGVHWVRETLMATTRLGEMQLRAYLVVEEASATFIRNSRNAIAGVEIKVIVKNGGSTPAINVGHLTNITEPIMGPSPKSIKPGSRSVVTMNTQAHRIHDLGPGASFTVLSETIGIRAFNSYNADHGKLNCNVVCHVQYRPVVSRDDKFLILEYWVRSDMGGKNIRISRSGQNEST
jgi:hypothetical protein